MSNMFFENVTFTCRTNDISLLPGDIIQTTSLIDELILDKNIVEYIKEFESHAPDLNKIYQLCLTNISDDTKNCKMLYLGMCTREVNYRSNIKPEFYRRYYKVLLLPQAQTFWMNDLFMQMFVLESKLNEMFRG